MVLTQDGIGKDTFPFNLRERIVGVGYGSEEMAALYFWMKINCQIRSAKLEISP